MLLEQSDFMLLRGQFHFKIVGVVFGDLQIFIWLLYLLVGPLDVLIRSLRFKRFQRFLWGLLENLVFQVQNLLIKDLNFLLFLPQLLITKLNHVCLLILLIFSNRLNFLIQLSNDLILLLDLILEVLNLYLELLRLFWCADLLVEQRNLMVLLIQELLRNLDLRC